MKIAFLNPQGNFDPNDSYWAEHPDFGGQLVYVKELAIQLAQQGETVDILTRQIIDPDWPEFAEPLDGYQDVTNLRIVRIPCGPQHFLPKEELWPWLLSEWVPNILAFYQRSNGLPDIFTAHYGDGGLAAADIKRETGIPFTFTGHSLGAQKMDKLGAAGNMKDFSKYHFPTRLEAERSAMQMADRIITSTSMEAREQYGHPSYADFLRIPAEKFSVIPPGVNTRIFTEEKSPQDVSIQERIENILTALPEYRQQLPSIISASRLDPKKNLVGLAEAYLDSSKLLQASNLFFAVRGNSDNFDQDEFWGRGDNPVIEVLGKLRADHHLDDKMIAVPLNSQLELAAAYRWGASTGSIFVLPAVYEAFGLAQLEAMACGLPAAATQNGGPSESMREGDKEFGVLFDPENPHDMAGGLMRMVISKEEWKKFQKAGIERVKSKYTWEQTAKNYYAAFQKVLDA